MNYNKLMKKARKTNAIRDNVERNGLSEVNDNYLDEFDKIFYKTLKEIQDESPKEFSGLVKGAVSDAPPDLQLRTVMIAIAYGIQTNDWDCVAEGLAMLENLHQTMTGEKYEVLSSKEKNEGA